MPADHPRRPGILSNTALALLGSLEDGFDEAKLRRTVELLTEALTYTTPGQPLDAMLRVNRGTALRHSDRPEDLERALRDWCTAACNEAASPDMRLAAATAWARGCAELGRWADAVAAYGLAVDLLTSVAGLQLQHADQETRLTKWTRLAWEAVAAALEKPRSPAYRFALTLPPTPPARHPPPHPRLVQVQADITGHSHLPVRPIRLPRQSGNRRYQIRGFEEGRPVLSRAAPYAGRGRERRPARRGR